MRCETLDGVKHASKKEAARWLFLKELEAAGVITNLRRQVRYDLCVEGIKIGGYIADFVYTHPSKGVVVSDVKSIRTAKLPLFRRNKRHMAAQFGIDVVEVFDPHEPA